MELQIQRDGRARKHPVLGDIGADHLRQSCAAERFDQFFDSHRSGFEPAVDRDPSVAGICAEDHFRGAEFGQPLAERIGLRDGDAAADRAGGPTAEYVAQGFGVFDAAAVLHLQRGRNGDPFEHVQVDRVRGLGPVQIDQVQPPDAAVLVASSRVERVFVIGGTAVVVALRQPDALAADQVYCRDNFNHSVKKFCRMRSPTEALFSG